MRHDLRVPYSTLLGVVSALQDEPDMPPEDRKEFLAILEREIHTSMGLTDDLYTL